MQKEQDSVALLLFRFAATAVRFEEKADKKYEKRREYGLSEPKHAIAARAVAIFDVFKIIPYPVEQYVDDKLNDLQRCQMLFPPHQPTQWVTSLQLMAWIL